MGVLDVPPRSASLRQTHNTSNRKAGVPCACSQAGPSPPPVITREPCKKATAKGTNSNSNSNSNRNSNRNSNSNCNKYNQNLPFQQKIKSSNALWRTEIRPWLHLSLLHPQIHRLRVKIDSRHLPLYGNRLGLGEKAKLCLVIRSPATRNKMPPSRGRTAVPCCTYVLQPQSPLDATPSIQCTLPSLYRRPSLCKIGTPDVYQQLASCS